MKLTIEIDDDKYLESYLSIVSLGVLECIKRDLIDFDDAMHLIYLPSMIDKLEKLFPDLSNAILTGAQLEDVFSHVPDSFDGVVEEIRELNYKSIGLTCDKKRHVFYKLKE